MLLTSGYNFEGYDIVSYIGHESAQVVLGTGIFSSLDVSLSDFLGSRSNSYENKLASAEKEAKEILIEKARNLGGNAIIGIDVDYTTFTKDVIGIIVGGTIVKIEKKLSEIEVKRIPNTEYNLSIPFRILDSIISYKISSNETYISLYGKNYLNDKIKGLEVKMIVETIFNDVIETPNIMFADIHINEENEMFTEYNHLKLERDSIKLLKSASVQIVKYITDRNEIIEVPVTQNKKIDITPEQLLNIRNYYGNDAVNRAYKHDLGWVCHCGMENTENAHVCKYCGREINFENLRPMNSSSNTDTFEFFEHIETLETLKDSKEIYDYLTALNCSDIYFNTVVLPEIKKYISQERIYGTMKDSAIKKLKELCLNR